MMSRIGQSSSATKVLVRRNILVTRTSFLPSTSRETWAIDWPDIFVDHQSFHPVKPFADGFHGLPSMALMRLGSSFPPSAETSPLAWTNFWISSFVLSRRDGFSRCSRFRVCSAFSISRLAFEPEHYPKDRFRQALSLFLDRVKFKTHVNCLSRMSYRSDGDHVHTHLDVARKIIPCNATGHFNQNTASKLFGF